MVDVLVIGCGYGGLGAALTLSQAGAAVMVCETMTYPGGCASTFQKQGYLFEAGATLFSGFAQGQLFQRWIAAHGLKVPFVTLENPISFRAPGFVLEVSNNRRQLVDGFCALPNAPRDKIRSFFALQERVADSLWPVFDQPSRLPPMGWSDLAWHGCRSWRYPLLLPLMNRPLIHTLHAYGLGNFGPLLEYCNALCQITVQASIHKAEAVLALAAMDYLFRGTGHIQGGIGVLGNEMLRAIRQCGGTVHLGSRVRNLQRRAGHWQADVRGQTIQAKNIIANVLPRALAGLVGEPIPESFCSMQERVDEGWGAAMLYLVIRDHPGLPRQAHHYQGIADSNGPLLEGNHIFCSLSAADELNRAPKGERTVTVSTHVPIVAYHSADSQGQAETIQGIQEQMGKTLKLRFPELADHILHRFPASPRTFQRFTGRNLGAVGGVPKSFGWHNYTAIQQRPMFSHCWLVGDSVFPGQSTLATAVGGARTARAVLRSLG